MNAFEKFNRLCFMFLQDINDICPELKEQIVGLRLAMNVANAAAQSNSQLMFDMHVCSPYSSYIFAKDDRFMSDVMSDEIKARSIIDLVKQIWTTLDDTNKSHVWRYLQNLCTLSDACK